jgi:hypothetical protein
MDKKTSGFKYWFYLIITFVFDVIGIGFGVYSLSSNQYISLLTLLFGLFGTQTVYKAKGSGSWNKATKFGFILSLVVVALSCVVLYIVPMFK